MLILLSIFLQSIRYPSFTSTKIGLAPTNLIADIVGIAVLDTVITSSLKPISKVFKAITRASVPLLTPIPYFDLFFFKNVFSNFVNYDMGLPGSGILIWHVVEPLEENYLSGVNNDRYSRAIELEEADGALDIGFESYLFMGNSNSFGWMSCYDLLGERGMADGQDQCKKIL